MAKKTHIPAESPFYTAKQDAERSAIDHGTAQTNSPSYRLAYNDLDFITRDELRPVRLQLELIKPELALVEQDIKSTVVIFGSARILDPEQANQVFKDAKLALAQNPEDRVLKRNLETALHQQKKSHYYNEARKLGTLITLGAKKLKTSLCVVTGGGSGIMEAANRGAADVDGKSIGLNIVLPTEQIPNAYITPELSFQFHYFGIRKMHFLMRAIALVAFPGGFGTLDELFEALTLIQTKKARRIPVILFGRDYWHKVINFETLVEEETISPSDLDLIQYAETAEQAWRYILKSYTTNGNKPSRDNKAIG